MGKTDSRKGESVVSGTILRMLRISRNKKTPYIDVFYRIYTLGIG